jgi:hypothetical protein
MTHAEMDAFAQEFGPKLRDFVADALRPVVHRLQVLEQARAEGKAALAAAIERKWNDANER